LDKADQIVPTLKSYFQANCEMWHEGFHKSRHLASDDLLERLAVRALRVGVERGVHGVCYHSMTIHLVNVGVFRRRLDNTISTPFDSHLSSSLSSLPILSTTPFHRFLRQHF
jgi:hypothetical protein